MADGETTRRRMANDGRRILTMDDGRWTMDDGRWTMDDGGPQLQQHNNQTVHGHGRQRKKTVVGMNDNEYPN